jgi:hypothetical protein
MASMPVISRRHFSSKRKIFRQPCYRLRPEVSSTEWQKFEQLARREAIFADLKVAASDLDTAFNALQRSFRKICTQVQLIHRLTEIEPIEDVDDHRRHNQSREPFLVRWPGVVAAGSMCETPIVLTDLFPTLLEAAGIDAANQMLPGGMARNRP